MALINTNASKLWKLFLFDALCVLRTHPKSDRNSQKLSLCTVHVCAAAAPPPLWCNLLESCGRTNSSQKSPKTANNPWLKPNERDIVFRLHDAQFSNPALLVIQMEKVIWPRRFSCIDCSIAKTSSLHCAPPHKGLNSPKRFTNLLSGSMSLILN